MSDDDNNVDYADFAIKNIRNEVTRRRMDGPTAQPANLK